jgi:hypothetical protein
VHLHQRRVAAGLGVVSARVVGAHCWVLS